MAHPYLAESFAIVKLSAATWGWPMKYILLAPFEETIGQLINLEILSIEAACKM